MNHQWRKWIDRLKSNDLTDEELLEFRNAVEGDPSRRDAYLSELLAEVALEVDGLPDPFATPMPEGRPARRRWPRIASIAAGLVALAAASYVIGRAFEAPPGASGSPVYATVADANAEAEGAGLRIGQPLGNRRIHLPDGSEIGLAMRAGALLEICGPADMLIEGPDKIRLESGRISTYAPDYARGFTIDTVDGEVIDLGTRFVAAAGTGSGTEIHVLEGLVETHSSSGDVGKHSVGEQHAAILKDGRVEPIDFLHQRLRIPLDPVLVDRDADGFPDVVETHYGTSPSAASSRPAALRIEETFADYGPGPLRGVPLSMLGGQENETWGGAGEFREEGLRYAKGGRALESSAGSLRTVGDSYTGTSFFPDPRELAEVGVTYISFVMKNPDEPCRRCFAGLLLYQEDREELFVGKLSVANSYGSRLKMAPKQDAYGIPMDSEPHLFVIRIDHTRLITDVFIDPVPGQSESSAEYRYRYQDAPDGDRIEVRSGCARGSFKSDFDEIRIGLTWDSVVPAADPE